MFTTKPVINANKNAFPLHPDVGNYSEGADELVARCHCTELMTADERTGCERERKTLKKQP